MARSGECKVDISIHAPREGGDRRDFYPLLDRLDFNPRPPRGGRRWSGMYKPNAQKHFNPRPPARGATEVSTFPTWLLYISIHAPREGGDQYIFEHMFSASISIHAPREGGDISFHLKPVFLLIFQSTPPARGATFHGRAALGRNVISIHAPREGGDFPCY